MTRMNYQKRIDTVLDRMTREKADWFFVTNLFNVRYLSGFTGSHGVLLIHRDRRYILTDGRYAEQVVKEAPDFEAVIQGDRNEIDAIEETVGDLSIQTVWFEREHCSYDRYITTTETIPAKAYIGVKDIVESQRAVKDAHEIKLMRQALKIAEDALAAVLGHIHEGMSERELAHALEDEMWKAGAAKESFDSLVLFGPNSSLCHGKPGGRTLRKGDIVLMDFGSVWQGYCSDITRTFFFGEPDSERKAMYACVLEANRTASAHIKAGIPGNEADEFARGVIRKTGRGDQFAHGLGHSLGLEIHEFPRMSPLFDAPLQAGNVITIEPGVYVPGLGGIRIEDTVVITNDGCEVLNRSSKEITIL